MPRLLFLGLWLATLILAGAFSFAATPRAPDLVLVWVVDGLRPDLIGPDTTPALDRLRRQGVEYLNAHSAFPTVTRVNAAVIATGRSPQSTGITSNSLYDRRVNGGQPFNTGDAANLWPFGEVRGGRIVQPPTLGELLAQNGRELVVVSSGSTGQALLLNPEVKRGVGLVINGGFEDGRRTAYPDKIDALVRQRFGLRPTEGKSGVLDWTERVLREYVLPELKPAVIIDWITEPDGTQHQTGVGSPESMAAIKAADTTIGQTLELLERTGRLAQTAIIVTADHGFAVHERGVAVVDNLIRAHLKQTPVSRDVTVTSDSQSAQFFFETRDPTKVRSLVEYLQQQPWVEAVFVDAETSLPAATDGRGPLPIHGALPGTFSLQALRLAPAQGKPDVLVTFRWNSQPNAFGYPGRHTVMQPRSGAITTNASGHGGLSPWVVRTPLILHGSMFKAGTKVHAPAGNIDITPTVLALVGVSTESRFEGRVLAEAFRAGPDEQKLGAETRVHEVAAGSGFKAALQLSSVGEHVYVDKAWRIDTSDSR